MNNGIARTKRADQKRGSEKLEDMNFVYLVSEKGNRLLNSNEVPFPYNGDISENSKY